MILFEFEGKKLLQNAGIAIPKSQLISVPHEQIALNFPLFLKAQVLSGKRKEAGGIIRVDNQESLTKELNNLFNLSIKNEKVEKALVEEAVEIEKEFYLSISYDTDVRLPVLSFSETGGTGIEERGIESFPINPLNPLENLPKMIDQKVLEKIITLFFEQDCLLLEINPLVKTKSGEWLALDSKVKLDDDAKGRHEDWQFSPRGVSGHTPTQYELEAKKIDQGDYRGVAGSTYFDLDGDIAVLSSGGGISLTALDTLLKLGGKPANYTEYSGNPPKEKVEKLTKIVLTKPDIHGLLVIGTVAANFTDIYETLSGIIEGLRVAEKELDKKFDFPIVVRRGGPRETEAFELLKNCKDFNLVIMDQTKSLTETAETMVTLAKEYEQKKGKGARNVTAS